MAKFLTPELHGGLLDDDTIWQLDQDLIFQSDILGIIVVPAGFQTDFASVPRIPIAYALYGNRAHRESVIHDLLYRKDARPYATLSEANRVFLEAMTVRNKPAYVRYPMYAAVCAGGWTAFHKHTVKEALWQK